MNEAWIRMCKDYIKIYEEIQFLHEKSIFDEEEKAVYEHNLLHDIIETFRSEVEN